jgi:triphosphoribosyl-dephospho-CoA synthase
LQGLDERRTRLHVLFEIIAVLDDTNLAHRGGLAGLRFAQQAARDFLAAGGGAQPQAIAAAQAIHRAFVDRRLSPGGAADLLAAACWVERVCGD